MLREKIDLYSYFNIKKPDGAGGFLEVYAIADKEFHSERLHPAVLVIPGGAYHIVSQREGEPIAIEFLYRGFNAFVLQYSVVNFSYPVQVREAAMAAVYIRENAKKYAVDGNQLAAIGFSAGGHLCASLSTLFAEPAVTEVFNQSQIGLIRPDAAILCYSVITSNPKFWHKGSIQTVSGGDDELINFLSLENRVTENTPPTFLWHTLKDSGVLIENSLLYAQKLREFGVNFELHTFQHGVHGLSCCNKKCDMMENVDRPLQFTGEWLNLCFNFLELNGIYLKK